MNCSSRYFSMPLVAILFIACTGCSRKDVKLERAFHALHRSYTACQARAIYIACEGEASRIMEWGEEGWLVGPESWEDLLAFDSTGLVEKTIPLLKKNDVIVNWGYEFRLKNLRQEFRAGDSTEAFPSGQFVLAYPKFALSNGGPVLIADGSVKVVSATELNAQLAQQGATE